MYDYEWKIPGRRTHVSNSIESKVRGSFEDDRKFLIYGLGLNGLIYEWFGEATTRKPNPQRMCISRIFDPKLTDFIELCDFIAT